MRSLATRPSLQSHVALLPPSRALRSLSLTSCASDLRSEKTTRRSEVRGPDAPGRGQRGLRAAAGAEGGNEWLKDTLAGKKTLLLFVRNFA